MAKAKQDYNPPTTLPAFGRAPKIYVVGHKIPDSDSVCSSLAYAYFLKKKGKNAIPVKLNEVNPETKFILNYFKVKIPETLKNAAGKNLILLDHNEKEQSPDNTDKAKILEVIDHHKISFSLPEPIYFWTESVGSTATMIAKKFFQEKIEIPRKIAGLLLSAILSDSVIFRSPTTTKEDIEIAKKLARIAKIKNLEKFGIEIKKKKMMIAGMSPESIIHSDFKNYDMAKKKVGMGQIEICDFEEVEKRKAELIQKLKEISQKENYNLLILIITDIIKQNSQLLAAGKIEYLEKAFGKRVEENVLSLPGVMSRKKQIVPPLMETFSKS